MKTITGKILSIEIGVNVKKKDGGTYEAWRLRYTDADDKIQEIAKPIGGLKYQPQLKAALEALREGDEFTADMEKNDRGYLEVVSIRKGSEMPSDTGGAAPKSYKTDKQYETAEERKARQTYIVRQTSLDRSVDLVIHGKIDEKNVLKVAEKFENWVMRKADSDSGEVE